MQLRPVYHRAEFLLVMKENTSGKKRKADLLLIAGCLLLALAALLVMYLRREEGAKAVVYVAGEPVASYPLQEDTEVTLYTPDGSSYNVLSIRDGRASVTDAGCPDRLCVQMHAIAYEGETITCLPNQTVVKIEGGAPEGVDVY